ncbi:phage tail protein [Liquorilactobacillus hordei]|uniref:phage tail protein n=1 Tax=Liquorilactobacillus hordei TaxID=468911 RepID=UPI0039EB9265
MAIVGLKMVTLALVDPKTQQLIKDAVKGLSASGIVQIDSTMLGTKTANITGLEGAATKVDGNNSTQDIYYGSASPAVAFDFNNLDFVLKQKILGNISDGKGGYVHSDVKPHVAVLIESESLDRANSIFFGFANGGMSAPSQNVATDTSTAQTREDDALTYTALSADVWNGQPYKLFYTGDTTYDQVNMLKEVFGGYVAASSSNTDTGTGK